MEPQRRLLSSVRLLHLLLTGYTLSSLLVFWPCSAIDIWADTEVIVENGTTGVLNCSFKSNQVVSSALSVIWSFQSSQPDNQFSKDSHTILYFANGKSFPGLVDFKERLHFIGDINKRDVSIQLSPVQFSDNGTYFCDVVNPPDVERTRARTELRVVLGASFSSLKTDLDRLKAEKEQSSLTECTETLEQLQSLNTDLEQQIQEVSSAKAALASQVLDEKDKAQRLQVQLERIRQAESLDQIKVILNDTNLTDISQLPET